MSVPLPTPEGPVITKTLATPGGRLAAQHRDELGALALREAADRLARRDAALHEHLVDLHAPVLRDGEQHVEDLGRLDVGGRLEQEVLDLGPAALEVALELRATRADLVRALEGFHPLDEAALGRGHARLGRSLRRWRHGRRVYIAKPRSQGSSHEFGCTSTRGSGLFRRLDGKARCLQDFSAASVVRISPSVPNTAALCGNS